MRTPWWKHAVIYQIYPRSFLDTNGDGVGDIPGIISKLDYLKDLGVDALWLSPVYTSPNRDYGYDIADYCDINPEYGTLEDMKMLIGEADKRGLRIIMDLVVNHTSDQHPWFQESRDPSSPKRDYYIWRKPRKGLFGKELPPNNWTSFFTGPAWTKDDWSGEYYLHLFTKQQPDLNYRNHDVVEEIKKLMSFWLDMGVAGFRCDVITLLYKESLENGKFRLSAGGQEYYFSSPGTHKVIQELNREVLKPHEAFTVGEGAGVNLEQARVYTAGGELDLIFSFDHVNTDGHTRNVYQMRDALKEWQIGLDWNTLFLENHDQPRSVSVFGNDGQYREASAKALATMILTLRGTPFIYQGQEIGMTNAPFVDLKQTKDPVASMIYDLATRRLHLPKFIARKVALRIGRDHARTPMQWTAGEGAGFGSTSPWVMLNPNYANINVEDSLSRDDSALNYYKRLISLRREIPALLDGEVEFIDDDNDLFVYRRKLGKDAYLVIINLTGRRAESLIELKGEIVLSTCGRGDLGSQLLDPYEAIIIKT